MQLRLLRSAMREPAFWWREAGLAAALLAPAAAVYGAVGGAAHGAKRARSAGVPVICVGNFTLGGAGKTPTAIMLAKMLAEAGERPFCLSRGYGGSEPGPKLVDANADHAAQVGDEALLLARVGADRHCARPRRPARRWRKRAAPASSSWTTACRTPRSPRICTLAVIDGRRGIGNGRVFPAGPLRAPLEAQLARSDALLVVGDGEAPRAT